jgi:mono/diheme cytochrome c family protein
MNIRGATSEKRFLCNAILLILTSSVCICAATQTGSKTSRNPEAAKLKNPVPSEAASIEEGKKIYARYCASCHGTTGKGDGSMALSGGTPSNLVDETWDSGSTDGEIFVVIRDGLSSDMEGYKDRLSEKQIWHLLNYIRSIGPKPASR